MFLRRTAGFLYTTVNTFSCTPLPKWLVKIEETINSVPILILCLILWLVIGTADQVVSGSINDPKKMVRFSDHRSAS